MIWRAAGWLIALALLYAGGQVAWRRVRGSAPRVTAAAPNPPAALRPTPAPAQARRAPASTSTTPPPAPCASAPAFAQAAAKNGGSLVSADWPVFGRPQMGWEIYAPLTAHEIGTSCSPTAEGFAEALARWQGDHGRPVTGIMDAATLQALVVVWLRRRPFVAATAHGACPPPPPEAALTWAAKDEGYLAKPIQLRPRALGAWRRMAAAARAEVPAIAADPRLLTIFSGYRSPIDDAARCLKDGNCGTAARANCSAHRTGLAMDLYLGAAPGFVPESSSDANRLFQSRTEAYRWLVRNADRFGFVNYPFEPWHWEWTGEAP